MSYLPPEVRLHINNYASSGIISNQRAFDEIKKLYPDFSLAQLYLKYVSWNTLYSNIRSLISIESEDIYNRIYKKLLDEGAEYSFIYENREFNIYLLDPKYITLFESLVDKPDESSDNGSKERTIYSFKYKKYIDQLVVMIKYFDILNCKPGNVNIIDYSIYTGNQAQYIHTIAPIIDGDNIFKQRYIDEIVKIDPNFSLQQLYNNIKRKYNKIMELDDDLINIIVENYDNIKVCSYFGISDDIVIGTIKKIDKWEHYEYMISNEYYMYSIDGDYSKFLSIVAILESDVNNNYNKNQQELHYYTYSTPIINPY